MKIWLALLVTIFHYFTVGCSLSKSENGKTAMANKLGNTTWYSDEYFAGAEILFQQSGDQLNMNLTIFGSGVPVIKKELFLIKKIELNKLTLQNDASVVLNDTVLFFDGKKFTKK